MSTERIEYLAQFSNHALSMMASGGYRMEDDSLEIATLEEIQAVDNYRIASFEKWAASNPFADLESMVQGPTVEQVILRVYGGKNHLERLEVSSDWLTSLKEEGHIISCDSYECTAKKDSEGNAYTEFRYFCSPTNNDVTTN
jgi:hypothetical protein